MDNEPEVVWEALKGSQTAFLNSPYKETLMQGSRGGGKTETGIMAFAKETGKGYGHRWTGVVFRRKYKDLDDVIKKSKRLFGILFPEAKFLAGKGDYKWVWPDGEELMFRKFDNIDDYDGFHGQELPFVLWEEITNWPTDECYEIMKSCNRAAKTIATDGSGDRMPLKYLSTTNPSGAGHTWVKKYFKIKSVEPYTPIEDGVGEKRVQIPSSVFENPHMDDDYVKWLFTLKDPNLRKAWLWGSWDIVAGGLFTEVWREKHCTVAPFEIPSSWRIDRSFDWGSSKPFSVIWYAESDGTDYVDKDGNDIPTRRGDVFAILEYYGAAGPNKGLRMTAREVALKIRDIEMNNPLLKGRNVMSGPADTSIFTVESGNCIASDMRMMGIGWKKADKSAGSRIAGWEVIRQRLQNCWNGSEEPCLRIFRGGNCGDLLRLLPVAPRDDKEPDDIDTDSEDHNLDSLRYRMRKKRSAGGSRIL